MLYDVEAVRANVRNRDGKRVFFLGKSDTLTPSARDYLQHERIELRPAKDAKIERYRTLSGEFLSEKPEHMTHLRGDVLVPKTAPIIAFRGAVDTLQAEILLAELVCEGQTRQDLEEILSLARSIIRCDVMQETAKLGTLCGLSGDELREHSQQPQKYYAQSHFMPSYTDGAALLQLNRARCAARSAELAAARAFENADGSCARSDILTLLNRMSSMLYILMIRLKKEGKKHG